jgi:hypothetical protein
MWSRRGFWLLMLPQPLTAKKTALAALAQLGVSIVAKRLAAGK